ncbi:hypothetical protein L579_2629 [Pantoea sp. AS-PWVM4]|nr:hypothetical protein L579_2629 [Pantoea sp. AS-PWVM4]
MRTIGQGAGGEAPRPVAACRHRTQQGRAVVDADLRTRLRRTAERRGVVVGGAVIGNRHRRAAVVVTGRQRYCRRSRDINHHGCRAGCHTDVTCRIRCPDGKYMATFRQCCGSEAPGAARSGDGRSQHRAAVIDSDGAVRFRRTAEGWCAVVGGCAVSNHGVSGVVGHHQRRDIRCVRINRKGHCRRVGAGITGRIGRRDTQRVGTVAQGRRVITPDARRICRGRSHHIGTIINGDHRIGFRRASQQWRAVVG